MWLAWTRTNPGNNCCAPRTHPERSPLPVLCRELGGMRLTQPPSLPCKIEVAPLKWVCASLEGRGCTMVGLEGEEK